VTTFIALLRAVNVGGTGKIAMSDLKRLCEEAGCANVRTYIASGNVILESGSAEARLKAKLEAALKAHVGKPVGVMVRSAAEMADVVARNPFPRKAPNRTVAIFLDRPPGRDILDGVRGRKDEEIRVMGREIYVRYPDGIGKSELIIPGAKDGTARNMNTVAKLAELAAKG
jgi:uncharacterized protein (DUF1697 family)